MEQLKKFLDETGILAYLNGRGAEAPPVYLVGGALRDCLQGKVATDFDFIMPDDPTSCAKGLAHIFNGTWFILDSSRNQSRVVMELDQGRIICDFAPFRAPTLDDDLRNRDFTINAMAWPCGAPSIERHLIDPLSGAEDLESGLLRICSVQSFFEDPLRTLKGIRHAACLQLTIDQVTFDALREAVPNIDQIAPERVRAELAQILSCDDVISGLGLLNDSGLLSEIFGQSTKPDAVALAINRLGYLEQLLTTIRTAGPGHLQSALNREFEEYLQLPGVLRLAVICRAYRPIALENVLRALRLSNRTVSFVLGMQKLDIEDRLAQLSELPVTERGKARWVEGLGREPIGSLLILMAEMLALQMDVSVVEQLADCYQRQTDNGKLVDLIDGNWLRTTYQINPGPVVGRLLDLIAEAELRGEIETVQDARKWLWENQKTIDNILLEKL